ncbi:glycosyltransferase [Phytoactinopolyspora alkaliphila]|uniref:Glycosyltransferase n=1 Tax=Phytoactinopolyspora alkaliphila TaxID=1783498 RepID=A0A6N9YJQ1_9ACTN|nr:glycosyltransferase [Phytoactinopolyspora alkaliphila]NED95109.1 glycosyltransferase [Phytoactinopolyspora alkaliphila]
MPSVVVPAHNEERVIARLLSGLLEGSGNDDELERLDDDERQRPRGDEGPSDPLEIVVVANGCDDATAEVARGFPGVRVIETPMPSKSAALRLGDEIASSFPRLYVDADVSLGAADMHELCRALDSPGVLAAGPARTLPMDGVAVPVRWYYDVWQRLPVVREELFGRGVIAVSRSGHERLAPFLEAGEQIMADDLAMSLAFGVEERVVVPAARVVIRPPRTYRDLMRRRIRAMTGNARLAEGNSSPSGQPAGSSPGSSSGLTQTRTAPRTGPRDLLAVLTGEPGLGGRLRLAPKLGVFLVTATASRVLARRAVRRRDTEWLRDESSRDH